MHRTLQPGGLIKFSTDDRDYFDAAQVVFKASRLFEETPVEQPGAERLTDFERMFVEQGLVIHRSQWRKL